MTSNSCQINNVPVFSSYFIVNLKLFVSAVCLLCYIHLMAENILQHITQYCINGSKLHSIGNAVLRGLRFPHWFCWALMQQCVSGLVFFTFWRCVVPAATLSSWQWRHYIPLRHQETLTQGHSFTSQKICILKAVLPLNSHTLFLSPTPTYLQHSWRNGGNYIARRFKMCTVQSLMLWLSNKEG